MFATQIHLYVRYRSDSSDGLARHFAANQLQQHLLILGHLSATYWAADVQRRLFNELISAIDDTKKSAPNASGEALALDPNSYRGEEAWVESRAAYDPMVMQQHDGDGIEEFCISFSPFMGPRSWLASDYSREWVGPADTNLG